MFLYEMSRMNDLSHVLGGLKTLDAAKSTLQKFWSRFRGLYPKHNLWRDIDSGAKSADRCIPLLLHGDEGTTYRKSGVLVLSFQGVIGFGTSKRLDDARGCMAEGIRLNFLRTGVQTRMLILLCHKDYMFNLF